jgi:Transposase DDE domain
VHQKNHLSFSGLRSVLSEKARSLPDTRQEGKVRHTIHDSVMCGFAMMYFQDPSLRQFQKRMEDAKQTSNMKNLFHVDATPGDKQLREVLDEVDPASLEEVFTEYFSMLQRGNHLKPYRVLGKYYAVVIDGSEYFSSEKLNCPGCLTRNKRFVHQIVQAAIVHPDKSQVVPLPPEAVKNTDGHEKQDCEINAGKRLIKKLRKTHPKLPLIIIGDSLYSKQPFMQDAGKETMRYVLAAKETDHEVLTQYVDGARRLGGITRLETHDHKGRLHVYEWINEVPLNGNDDAPLVNYFTYSLIVNNKRTYYNSWVTDIPLEKKNIEELSRIGRMRWKIENEVFNTVKNHGYHIEHNYGHGVKNLSYNFFLLNMLAFFMHQIFELTDRCYQACRQKLGSKKNLWDHLRVSMRMLIFPDWETLLRRVYRPSEFW